MIIEPKDVQILSSDDQVRRQASEALLARLDSRHRYVCEICKEPQGTFEPSDKVCPPCQELARREAHGAQPRAEIFRRAHVPLSLRVDPPWKEGEWPRDPRRQALPVLDWVGLAAKLADDDQRPGPRSVLLRGCNGAGKSHRAADLVLRLHRAGLSPAFWVREEPLVEEMENTPAWDVKPIIYAAREAKVLVLDDMMSTVGDQGLVKRALGMIFELIDYRSTRPSKITVYTTHRRVATKEPDSIKGTHPGIFSRLMTGLVLDCGEKDHRGLK